MKGFFIRLFGSRQSAALPPDADTDDVYPVHVLDNMTGVKESCPIVLMRFNDVLDAEKLHASLVRVLELGDWKKAGGRFRKDAAGRLQLRVPKSFTAERPAVRFSRATFDIGIEEHPLARQLPRETAAPSLQLSPDHFGEFCMSPGGQAGELNDFLECDEPPMSLRVTTFSDATLVAVSWSHIVADAGAFKEIVAAWCQVLAGQEDQVAPVLGAREDAAVGLWEGEDPNPEEYMWQSKMLEGLRFLWFGLRFAWEILTMRKVTARTLFLPASFVAELRREAEGDLKDGTFISDGDILCAWLARLFVASRQWNGPVTVLNVVDIRGRAPSFFSKAGVYLQNLTMPSLTFLTSSELLSGPLGILASGVRHSIAQQVAESQIRAIYRKAIPYVKSKGRPPVFGHPTMLLVPVSNWTKSKFIESVDFSPAILRAGDVSPERRNPPGKMVYQITAQVKPQAMVRNTAVIIAKDHSGNYWVNLYLVEPSVGRVEEFVRNAVKAA
ncbi:hypothetical protein BX600DRAFT_459440 [Xylariales sp. PMI_506]|nr:hypothetical protein BX600DRAFT_459440 [Xylariales sp. PMI_506]